jgi:hypothetical protein
VGAERLNSILSIRLDVRWIQREMMRLSSATTNVAAGGPNIKTAAKTNVSDTDKRAGMDGTLIVNEPLRRVKPAQTNQMPRAGIWENA